MESKDAPRETVRLAAAGTTSERWIFHEERPELRTVWPTAELAYRLEDDARKRGDHVTAGILSCYRTLLRHPAGTEDMVQHLRALRRAERGRDREVRRG